MICPTAQGEFFQVRLARQMRLSGFDKFDFWRRHTDILVSSVTTESHIHKLQRQRDSCFRAHSELKSNIAGSLNWAHKQTSLWEPGLSQAFGKLSEILRAAQRVHFGQIRHAQR